MSEFKMQELERSFSMREIYTVTKPEEGSLFLTDGLGTEWYASPGEGNGADIVILGTENEVFHMTVGKGGSRDLVVNDTEDNNWRFVFAQKELQT